VTAAAPIDRRMLAALRLRDAAGAPVTGPVAVEGAGLRFVRKAGGELVLTAAPGFEAYAAAFPDAPPIPAVGSVALDLDLRPADPGLAPRRLRLALPRHPDASEANALARAIEVTLPPSVAARLSGLAAGLLVTLRHADGRRVEGAVVRLRPTAAAPTLAITNAAGEALLIATGLPLAPPASGASVTPVSAAALDAVVEAGAVRLHPEPDLAEARAAEARRRAGFVDPERLLEALADGAPGIEATPEAQVALRPGETRAADLTWTPA
jgi:hypothetical protein